MAPRGKKRKEGSKDVWDYWEDTRNGGVKILHKKGHLAKFKAGGGIGKRKTVNGYQLQPPHFPFPVEIYRSLISFRKARNRVGGGSPAVQRFSEIHPFYRILATKLASYSIDQLLSGVLAFVIWRDHQSVLTACSLRHMSASKTETVLDSFHPQTTRGSSRVGRTAFT